MINNIIDVPYYLIKEYLTGWTILLFIIIIIYFVSLRKYYIQKEQFYDINDNDNDNIIIKNKKINSKLNSKANSKANNKANNKANSKANSKAKAKSMTNTKLNKKINKNNKIEGFENNNDNENNNDTTINETIGFVDTTLFNNLKLNQSQVKQCKVFYNKIIIEYITELLKLLNKINTNEYLNNEKQFNSIITKGVDKIIDFLNNNIKSMTILTRSSIKKDLLTILSSTIDNLINKINNDLTDEINDLAKLNSTTIDYTSMVKNINVSRKKIEEYIEINKLVSNYGTKTTDTTNKLNKVLDNSFILPIYEKNFDRINQLIKSDFNNDYTKLEKKYGKAYTDFLNQKKKEELTINPLEIIGNIESGAVNFLSNINKKDNSSNNSSTNNNINNNKKIDLIEQYNSEFSDYNNEINNSKTNPIPLTNEKLINETHLNKNNIYKNESNLGNYLINNTTQNKLLEGFENDKNKEDDKKNSIKNKTTIKNTNIIENIISGDFLNYIMEFTSEKLNLFYTNYNKNFNSDDNDSNTTNFNLDNNLIPAGFLLFILSMLFYFIDVTS